MLVKKNKNYSLYFLITNNQQISDSGNYIKIVPSRSDWNDCSIDVESKYLFLIKKSVRI